MKSINEVMKALKCVRQKSGYSVQDVATYIKKNAGIEVSPKTVYGWEEGNSKPDISCFISLCSLYGIKDVPALFEKETAKTDLSENKLGLQRAINLLSAIRDDEYVEEGVTSKTLSDNMKTEILYQLMERAEKEGHKREIIALKWAILQIERQK